MAVAGRREPEYPNISNDRGPSSMKHDTRLFNYDFQFARTLPTSHFAPHVPAPPITWGSRLPVAGFALVLLLVLSLWGLFRDRIAWLDTLGLYNPVYTFVHFHKMTYPVHGRFDQMDIHPPTHYLAVGWLMRAGIDLYYAVAIPFLAISVLQIYLISRARFPAHVKLGLMIGFFLTLICWYETFDLRPDWQVALVWFTGLIALESARLDDWELRKLGLGSFLLTCASGLHYFGSAAFIGAGVYAAWALCQLGFRAARSRLLAIVVGGCLFGIPYLACFLLPNWRSIIPLVTSIHGGSGLTAGIQRHYEIYAAMFQTASGGHFWSAPLTTLALEVPFRLHIPLFFLAAIGLGLFRSTRGFVLAGAPHVFLVFYISHKWASYAIAEYLLYFSAVGVVSCALISKLLMRMPTGAWRWVVGTSTFLIVTLALLYQLPGIAGIDQASGKCFHEMDLARAVGREINKPGALVGAQEMLWYITGTTLWCNAMSPSASLPPSCADRATITHYWSQFDAIGDFSRTSDHRGYWNRKGTFNWYLDGLFALKGFYFGLNSTDLSYLLFSVTKVDKVIGYGLTQDGCYRFEENTAGDSVFVSLVGPAAETEHWKPPQTLMSNVILLPKLCDTDVQSALLTLVMPRCAFECERESMLMHAHLHEIIYGDLRSVDPTLLVNRLAHEDQVIRFYRTIQEAVADRSRVR